MALTLEAALERVPYWRGAADLKATLLAGGLTNSNYRVEAGGQVWVLRLTGTNTALLGIDRRNEHAAHLAAARLGIAPEVLYFIEPEGCLVTRFVNGRPIPVEAMRQPENIARTAAALRMVHAMPPIPGSFSPFRVVDDYLHLATDRGIHDFPDNFDWLLAQKQAIEAAMARDHLVLCPCHNDLLNENFMLEDSSGELRILDWEYAGMGDRVFDLANFAALHGFQDTQDRLLLECYFNTGQVSERRLARLKLLKCMSDFREAMWGMAQLGLSSLDFDYRAYAGKFFEKLTAGLSDPRCPAWLEALDAPA